MAILNIIALIILIIYVALLLFGASGFTGAPVFNYDPDLKNHTKVCIIICARNEEKNIERCLRSIMNQNFDRSLLQIIVMSDGSSDNTFSIATETLKGPEFSSMVFKVAERQGKKRCIESAIKMCQGDLIITRDADTFTNDPNWLTTIVSFHEQTKKEFIIAPLQIENKNNFLSQLQIAENWALTIITGGYAFYKKAFLCNGANLAFTKNLFEQTNGYASHIDVPSGDDVLFLEDVKKINPETIAYLKQKEASVYTYSAQNFGDFIDQRTRWASKFKINPNPLNFFNGFCGVFSAFFYPFLPLKTAFLYLICPYLVYFLFLAGFLLTFCYYF